MRTSLKKKRFAVTGGIACGKSVFARFLAELGCEVLDADAVVHRLEAPGGRAVPLLAHAFGPAVCSADGGILRKVLGRLVFSDPVARERLNAIIHPLVWNELDGWFGRPQTGTLRFAVVPLLFEAGWRDHFDTVVCLACSAAKQLERLISRGLTEHEAALRIGAQMPIGEKVRLSDRVVWNDGSLEALRREADGLVRDLSESGA
ncbi:MAG: dephospho-CoA kinase [Lentisphaerae bacterium]|nr:dephospho-CoA kinase [Lentisphaerota bacterium]